MECRKENALPSLKCSDEPEGLAALKKLMNMPSAQADYKLCTNIRFIHKITKHYSTNKEEENQSIQCGWEARRNESGPQHLGDIQRLIV